MSEQIQELLDLETVPIAVTFHDAQPDNIPRPEKVEASGCTYWRRAACLLYTSPSPRDRTRSRMPSSA